MVEAEAVIKAQKYLVLIKDILQIQSAYLFGSYAAGTPRIDSDIDIGIFTKSVGNDYFAVLKKLFTIRRDIDTLIEPHLFIENMDISGFHDEVKKGIKLI